MAAKIMEWALKTIVQKCTEKLAEVFLERRKQFCEQTQQWLQGEKVLRAGDPPPGLTNYQERLEETEKLQRWLQDKNLILIGIEGFGGTGKSSLAAKIYQEENLKGRDFRKRFWVDCLRGRSFSEIAQSLLKAFEWSLPQNESKLVQAVVQCLRSGNYLLIIDNLENLMDEYGQWCSELYEQFFREWIEYGDNSTVLVTTRNALLVGRIGIWSG